MKKRKILVTGVCGLIGSHLLDQLLERGEEVVGVDNLSFGKMSHIQRHLSNKKFKFVKLDVTRETKLKAAAKDVGVICHLAAVKKVAEADSALPTLMDNILGTESVLKAARAVKARVVLGSTSDVYGASPDIPFKEEGNCVVGSSTAKRWAYAVSKLFCEHLALSYHKDFGVPVVVLRYFGCFSERSSTTWSGGHVPIFIEAAKQGKPFVIHGDGLQTRSMAHVSDIVRGTLLAMDNPKALGEIINLGNDEEVSVLDCAKMISKLIFPRKKPKIKRIPMKRIFGTYKEIVRRVPDLSKARKILGYVPKISFEKALRMVIERQY